MIRPLRKAHVWIWRLLVVILPLFFIAAMIMRPPDAPINDQEKNDFLFLVNPSNKSTTTITISLVRPLKAASCLVVLEMGGNEAILGKINDIGDYTFETHLNTISNKATIRLVDFVRNKEITSYRINKKP